jgi:transcriptional regulator with XRE-family HTH domain
MGRTKTTLVTFDVVAERYGDRVEALRLERDWSQEKLARMLDMSRETVRAAETRAHLSEWPTLVKMAEVFGVGLDYLLGFSDERITLDQLSLLSAAVA